MNISAIYEKVGGREEVARLCGVSTWATYKWDAEGIPSKHWRTLADELSVSLEVVASADTALEAKAS